MKRLLALLLPTAALVAGCGGTGDCGQNQPGPTGTACSSSAVEVATPTTANCTLAASSCATVEVTLCSKCTDSTPSCQAEFLTDHFEFAPTVFQCQENAGCAVNGCNFTLRTATCKVTVPSTPGTYPVVVQGSNTISNGPTITVTSGSGGGCTL